MTTDQKRERIVAVFEEAGMTAAADRVRAATDAKIKAAWVRFPAILKASAPSGDIDVTRPHIEPAGTHGVGR